MKKFTTATLSVLAAVAFAAPAMAADQAITINCLPDNSACSGGYNFGPVGAGNFSQGFTFSLPGAGKFGGSLTTEFSDPISDIDFISIFVDGVHAYTKDLTVIEPQERWSISNLVLTGGPHRIDVTGTSAGFGSFAGTVSFAAVPEPATWGMMILGFGLIGGALRSRKKVAVRYA